MELIFFFRNLPSCSFFFFFTLSLSLYLAHNEERRSTHADKDDVLMIRGKSSNHVLRRPMSAAMETTIEYSCITYNHWKLFTLFWFALRTHITRVFCLVMPHGRVTWDSNCQLTWEYTLVPEQYTLPDTLATYPSPNRILRTTRHMCATS